MCIYAKEPASMIAGIVAAQTAPWDAPCGILIVQLDLICPLWNLKCCLEEILRRPIGILKCSTGSSGVP
eukprot:4750426-Lingulodinium_polyedra.AAC.1